MTLLNVNLKKNYKENTTTYFFSPISRLQLRNLASWQRPQLEFEEIRVAEFNVTEKFQASSHRLKFYTAKY